jgi:uncharacterized membrane protein
MPTARNFFSAEEQEMLMKAIDAAEMKTSGEIRLHLESFCLGSEIKAAKKIFKQLNMQATAERNGVLIYIATLSHKIAVIGDEGIHQKLGQAFWEQLVNEMITKFRQDKKAEALADCIVTCGEQLGRFFPRKADDKNELSNSISY